jgi:hypothetical protein
MVYGCVVEPALLDMPGQFNTIDLDQRHNAPY